MTPGMTRTAEVAAENFHPDASFPAAGRVGLSFSPGREGSGSCVYVYGLHVSFLEMMKILLIFKSV